MNIAVTYANGEVFQHFGHTEVFKIYEVENNKVVATKLVEATEGGHSALAGLLSKNDINALICGGIGGGAQTALAERGIALYGGVAGDADKAVEDLIQQKLVFQPDIKCNHFESHHGAEGEHHCHGADGCTHTCK
ncbi:MAG: NifB/NifX family molybdenum-iron cluster-binding protein [Oscillospiraceae bacterium]